MVRHYKPKNPIDPGSKLSHNQTLGIIRYLIAGRRGAWIAKMEGVSENTVSSVASKFRKKMRTSPVVRQGCFEPFYVSGVMSKEFYEWVLDLPSEDSDYYQRAAHCALHCPSEFENQASDWSHFIRGSNQRLLNMGQSQRLFETAFGDGFIRLRHVCSTCPVSSEGPLFKKQFHNFMGFYLRERNLRKDSVQEHYLVCAVYYFLHYKSMFNLGITWTNNEIIIPDEIVWDQLPVRFAEQMKAGSFALVQYFCQFLEEDPLTK